MDKITNFFKKFWSKTKEICKACARGIKNGSRRTVEAFKDPKERALIWDKCTTGLLMLVFATPLIIIVYIFSWFLTR